MAALAIKIQGNSNVVHHQKFSLKLISFDKEGIICNNKHNIFKKFIHVMVNQNIIISAGRKFNVLRKVNSGFGIDKKSNHSAKCKFNTPYYFLFYY